MPTLTRSRATPAKKPAPTKSKRGGAAVVGGGVAVGGLLLWWLLRGRRGGVGPPPGPPPANPVVNVGNDQAVTLDITAHAEITITYSVAGPNPVNLAWSLTFGPGPVNFSPLGPNQELVWFTVPGNHLIRLTATDVTDSRAQGFDEMAVTVNQVPLAAILGTGELKIDGFASYTLTRALGDTLSFVWPVTNVGSLAGAAFIRLTEAGAEVGSGAPFPIDPGQTVNVNFNPVVNLSPGVHILVATMMEGLPPNGVAVGSPQAITLTVVSLPVLSPVGEPSINGIVGATFVSVPGGATVPISWAVRNTGGGAGQAWMQTSQGGGGVIQGVTSSLITVPANTTRTLLLAITTSNLFAFKGTFSITLTMRDEQDVTLGSWQFILVVV